MQEHRKIQYAVRRHDDGLCLWTVYLTPAGALESLEEDDETAKDAAKYHIDRWVERSNYGINIGMVGDATPGIEHLTSVSESHGAFVLPKLHRTRSTCDHFSGILWTHLEQN